MINRICSRQQPFEKIYDQSFGGPTERIPEYKSGRSSLSKMQVLDAIKSSKQSEKFTALYENNTESPVFVKYRKKDGAVDDSSADMAFFSILAYWCQRDRELMLEVALSSRRVRLKWDNREDYIEGLLKKAISGCEQTYLIDINDLLDFQESDYLFEFKSTYKEAIRPTDWVINGYLTSDSIAALVGDTGTGKTFLSMGWGLSVATGTDWYGHTVEQGAVLYLCGEGMKGILKRKYAWGEKSKLNVDNVEFGISNSPVLLLDDEQFERLCVEVNRISENKKIRLIIIDTLNTNWGDGDENNAQDMTKFVIACRKLREATGACILIVHHTGLKAKSRGRGSSSLKAALDTEILLLQSNGALTLKITKQKDEEMTADCFGRIEPIKLEDNISSAVFKLTSEFEPIDEKDPKNLTKKEMVIVCIKNGFDPNNSKDRKRLKSRFNNSTISLAKSAYENNLEKYKYLDKYSLNDLGLDKL